MGRFVITLPDQPPAAAPPPPRHAAPSSPAEPPVAPSRRLAFTLIEILIVVVILGILATAVLPRFLQADEVSRSNILSNTVRYVRQMVIYYRQTDEFPHADSGFPEAIEAAWFRGDLLPPHTWTGSALVIEVVDGDPGDVYPASKTFNPGDSSAVNAWYNRTNGAFCALVPPQEDDSATLELFNAVNIADASSLGDTG